MYGEVYGAKHRARITHGMMKLTRLKAEVECSLANVQRVNPADDPLGVDGQVPAGAQHPALHDRHQAKFGALLEIQAQVPAAPGGSW